MSKADDDVNKFILELEQSARKILKDSNKRLKKYAGADATEAQIQAAQRGQLTHPTSNGTPLPALKTIKKSGTILINAGKTVSTAAAINTMQSTSNRIFSSTGGFTPTDRSHLKANSDFDNTTRNMKYSVPKMIVSMSADTLDIASKTYSEQSAFRSTAAAADIISKKSGTLKSVKQQPEEEFPPAPQSFLPPPDSTTWELKKKASNILAGRGQGVVKIPVHNKSSRRRMELQGPVDWASKGLRSKYRGESEREEAWMSWKSANAYAAELYERSEEAIPLTQIIRHPLYSSYTIRLAMEFLESCNRSKNRMKMKRFVLDLHEVWLTNLPHLKEHQPSDILSKNPKTRKQAALEQESASTDQHDQLNHSSSEYGNNGNNGSNSRENEGVSRERKRLLSLEGRRDSRAILAMDSQIQSVSQKRSHRRAYGTKSSTSYTAALMSNDRFRSGSVDSRGNKNGNASVKDNSPPPERCRNGSSDYSRGAIALGVSVRDDGNRRGSTESRMASTNDTYPPPFLSVSVPILNMNSSILETLLNSMPIDCRVTGSDEIWGTQMLLSAHRMLSDTATWRINAFDRQTMLEVSVTAAENILLKAVLDKNRQLRGDKNEETLLRGLSAAILKSLPLQLCDAYLLASAVLPYIVLERKALPDYVAEGEGGEEIAPMARAELSINILNGLITASNDGTDIHRGCDWEREMQSTATSLSLTASGTLPTLLKSRNAQVPTSESGVINELVPGACDMRHQGLWGLAPRVDRRKLSVAAPVPSVTAVNGDGEVDGNNPYVRGGEMVLRRSGGDGTRVAALFERVRNKTETRYSPRDVTSSRYLQIKVLLILALDATEIFVSAPYCVEGTPSINQPPPGPQVGQGPDKWPLEHIEDPNPIATTSPPTVLFASPLVNAIQERLALLTTIFDTCPTSMNQPNSNIAAFSLALRLDADGRGAKGFRCRLSINLLDTDPNLPTVVFGVSSGAALPNSTGVNTRNIWHATQAITDKINRVRDTADHLYIATIHKSSGANEPDVFTAHMRSGEFLNITSSFLQQFEDSYDATRVKREQFARQMALEGKIEASEMILKARKKDLKISIQRDMQLALEKKIRKVSKSERGWKKRFEQSSLIETQGDWEKRLDGAISGLFMGLMFFRRIEKRRSMSRRLTKQRVKMAEGLTRPDEENRMSKQNSRNEMGDTFQSQGNSFGGSLDEIPEEQEEEEEGEKYAQTCQWEVPGTWIGDPLSRYTDENNGDDLHDPEGYGDHSGMPQWSVDEDGNVTSVDDGGVLNSSALELSGAFQMPDEDWTPGDDMDEEGGEPAFRAMGTPGAALRGDKRWNTVAFNTGGAGDTHSITGGTIPTGPRGDRNADLKSIAERLVSNDELMKLLAKRLGLPEPPKDAGNPPPGPRPAYGQQGSKSMTLGTGSNWDMNGDNDGYDEDDMSEDEGGAFEGIDVDDLWSDDGRDDDGDGVVAEEEMEQFLRDQHAPQTGPNNDRRARKVADKPGSLARQPHSTPASVGYLQLGDVGANSSGGGGNGGGGYGSTGAGAQQEADSGIRGMGWRKLPRPEVSSTFYAKCCSSHTLGSSYSTNNPSTDDPNLTENPLTAATTYANTPTYLAPIAPIDACHYVTEDFNTGYESIFVKDARIEIERSMAMLDRNVRREELFAQSVPTEDLLLIQAKELENTTVDKFIAQQFKDDMSAAAALVPRPTSRGPKILAPQQAAQAVSMALLAAKNDNLEAMEDALADSVTLESSDMNGNTLLILAAQVGSKRMCKFLLRRGARMNAQNVSGNTVLHYTVSYNFPELTKYLISKGAKETILNVEGLTCYEGLSNAKAIHREFD